MQPISKQACKRGFPCAVCGKEDHCFCADFGNGPLWFCSTYTDQTINHNGSVFVLKGFTEQGYARYEEKSQYERNKEAWIREQERTNPNWHTRKKHRTEPTAEEPQEKPEKNHVTVDDIVPLSNKRLHQVYSYMLDLLILEDNHKKALLDEWNCGVDDNLGGKILSKWPIRSLPMNDRARCEGCYNLKNITRQELVKKMVDRFGTLKGVPGFFLETDTWTDQITGERKSDTHWQLVNLSGIVYPAFDSDGYIYRIRIGDEHPDVREYARDSAGNYLFTSDNGKKRHVTAATYSFNNRSGEWYRFTPDGNRSLVYSNQKKIYKVKLSPKGYPIIDGKVDGKYKNFSSRAEKTTETDTQIIHYNAYPEGTRSGSPISLYCKPGDNMSIVYITEGEKKAIVMNMLLGCPVISLPGVQFYPDLFKPEYGKDQSIIDKLKEKGLAAVVIVYDADKVKNDMVRKCEEGAVKRCLENGLTTFIADWNIRFGKGADDALIQGLGFQYTEKIKK